MNKQEIEKAVKEIVSNHYEFPIEDLTNDSVLEDEVGLDSLDVVELILTLETKINITIPDEETENIKTVGDMVTVIDLIVNPV